ncbi:uncharacterized protein LOC106662907 [Cimex lectularius]|uniref:Uncharacterized protein n=1 Tax=Cimex lectularius TaxID=79782 RepID=A0A8I6RBQ5_CIMLE|nr:uncharacterized protein LOC106662907 [Cimex lectularius]
MKWVLIIGLLGFVGCEQHTLITKMPQVTRTQLHVARSLNPDETEQMTVKTRTGEVATLIVRKRDGKKVGDIEPPPNPQNVPKPKRNETTARGAKDARVPPPVDVRSTLMFVNNADESKRGRKLEIDQSGIPVVTGVRVPDDPEDKHNVWRNARVINGVLVPYEKKEKPPVANVPPVTKEPLSNIEWLKMEPITTPVGSPLPSEPIKSWAVPKPTFYAQEAIKVVDYPQSQDSEEDKYVTNKILEYIKSVNQLEVDRQHLWDRDTRGFSRGLREKPRIEARVLHTPGATIYPTSLLYSPPSAQNTRVNVEEGVRTPVLQYAHPELGVQPARSKPSEEENLHFGRDQAMAYFAQDIHSDRSPYAFEPGLEEEARVHVLAENNKRSNSGTSRPKKTLSYFYQNQAIPQTDKYYVNQNRHKDSYIRYNEYVDRRPFWEKLGDTIKEHVEYGVEKVQDITRPVMEPLVEASHKISQNLGFNTGTRQLSTFKEKLGVAGTNSMLLPAIGLVAGGAALGLGAVAVGRFLDIDMLKRSNGGTLTPEQIEQLTLEHKRALESVQNGRFYRQEKRLKRSTEEDLQQVGHYPQSEGLGIAEAAWGSTPCAKRVFCQVMTSRSEDDVTLMEKKMSTFLNMLHPSMAGAVSYHLDDVMDAIRRKDCSVFQCPSGHS